MDGSEVLGIRNKVKYHYGILLCTLTTPAETPIRRSSRGSTLNVDRIESLFKDETFNRRRNENLSRQVVQIVL